MLPIAHIHPIVVHFPIVFLLTLAAFDMVALLRGHTISASTSWGNISMTLAVLVGLSALVTFIAGDLAYDAAIANGVNDSLLETHESLGTWMAVFAAIWGGFRFFSWWRDVKLVGNRKVAVVLVESAAALMIIVTAYFGGQLVYNFGVNVARVAAAG